MIASMTIPLRGAFRTFFDEFSTVHGDFCSKFFLPAFADIASCLDSAFYQEPLPFVDVIANGVGSLAECYAVDEIRFRILTFFIESVDGQGEAGYSHSTLRYLDGRVSGQSP